MSDSDSPTEGSAAPTQYDRDPDEGDEDDAESGDDAPESEQTTASERNGSDRSSEPERVRGLMATVGRKETEKQAAIRERDAAVSALADLQAEYDVYLAGYQPEAPVSASAPVAEPEPVMQYTAPVLRERSGMAPANPNAQPRPRMSEADAALRGMEQVYAEHIRGVN